MDSAYSYFRSSEYTVPFQIDTQQARLYLLGIENEMMIDVVSLFEKAHLLLMKPVASNKDNEEKQIRLLKYYLKRTIKDKLPDDFLKTIDEIEQHQSYTLCRRYCIEFSSEYLNTDFINIQPA